jgi:hypothetical protein
MSPIYIVSHISRDRCRCAVTHCSAWNKQERSREMHTTRQACTSGLITNAASAVITTSLDASEEACGETTTTDRLLYRI